jgi:hypothetical protein
VKRSSQELGEKRFRALQIDTPPGRAYLQREKRTNRTTKRRARSPPRSRNVWAGKTICTSSSIRTLTVGSGFAPDLLTPRARGRHHRTEMLARALAGSQASPFGAGRHTAGGEFHPALKTY